MAVRALRCLAGALMNVLQAVRVGLAVHRLTRLVTEDEIMRPAREAIAGWAFGAPEFSFKERVDTLIQCGRCVSVWAAAAVILAETLPPGRILTSVLAASDVSVLLGLLEE
jgi:hypothetical protein